ncbi:NIPSNAP protein [Stella humosa]|uniref:NIPSNAP protein n=1 Tax=Stella humosa TaxID=94 RepID=A0A3N1LKR3_9PROT|nr:NIPSNAP family protein [Stella humosa]ROP91329.1 NIPSNAP protein [Stella humosa]BBK34314.1 NIPSNAP family protein [Stella humosa]
MLYDLTTLTLRPATVAQALPRLEAWLSSTASSGELLGCWVAEVGLLNTIMVLRGYGDDRAGLLADHAAITESDNPFGIGDVTVSRTMDAYQPFPFLPAIRPGKYGPVYEVRTYMMAPHGLAPTIAGWEETLPGRLALSTPLVGMYSVTGNGTRFVHIWPYASMNARLEIRTEAQQKGLWPPKGRTDRLIDMKSELYLPATFSPTQ